MNISDFASEKYECGRCLATNRVCLRQTWAIVILMWELGNLYAGIGHAG